ncbi:MAG: hypothetical protein ACKVT2_11445 [Saprospiraceae bacterium]
MTKFIVALFFSGTLASPLFAQFFTGTIYGETVSVQLDSVGKNAWQGYLLYRTDCYTVAAAGIDSLSMASHIRPGLRLYDGPNYGFSISGNPTTDSLQLTEQEIVKFPVSLNPAPRIRVLLRKGVPKPDDSIRIERHRNLFALPSTSLMTSSPSFGQIHVSCFLRKPLMGVWESIGGPVFLSFHPEGSMMMFALKKMRNEPDFSINYSAWCADLNNLYTRGPTGNSATVYGKYTLDQNELTITRTDGYIMTFHRR